jgi:hypothetical protein
MTFEMFDVGGAHDHTNTVFIPEIPAKYLP